MRIVIDIDGVLTDEKRYVIDYGTKFFSENNISYIVRDDKFYGQEIFGVTKEQYKTFLNDYIFNYSINVSVRPFAKEIIKRLKQEHEIIFCAYMLIGQIISYALTYILYTFFYDTNILSIAISIMMFFLIIACIYLRRVENFFEENK